MGEKLNLVEALNKALKEKMDEYDEMVVLGEDVGVDGGVFRVTDGLYEKYGEERVFDTPLDETGIIGSSVGIASAGARPVAEIQFSGFIPQGFHQLKQHVSRMRTRTRGEMNLPMVVRAPYGGGIRALEHHSESQEAIYSRMGGLKVVIPSNPQNAYSLLKEAIDDPDPVLFLEPKKIYRSFKEEVEEKEFDIGDARIAKEGEDVTVVSWGAMFHETRKAVEAFEDHHGESSIELIDLQTINPLDEEEVLESVEKTGRLVVVAEEPKFAGISSEIAALTVEEEILDLKAPVKRVTGFDVPYPLYRLENYYMPSEKRISKALTEVLEF
ncbi:MAG: alpha-ketoacid dehydrogenase subunit beta [Candidatus Nanohaloarchaeota archaeon QJJ-9]|nr:alpha-ketoacid dehydrogenase subunit beta [Candidatus Nanohaloarchaeota archaeon QJJ-9]